MKLFSRIFSFMVCASALVFSDDAHAVDFYSHTEILGSGSTWSDDGAIQGAVRIGLGFGKIGGVEVLGRIGYGAVDDRLLEMVGVGGKIGLPFDDVRPYFRAAAIHQHEAPVAGFGDEPVGHVLGVGDGIRHRFGAELGLGTDFVVWHTQDRRVELLVGAEAHADLFPDDLGPTLYAGGGASIGVAYGL